MCKWNNIKLFVDDIRIIDIALNNEGACAVQELLACSFQGLVIVVVEIVETHNPVSPMLERHGDMGPDKTGSSGHKHHEMVT